MEAIRSALEAAGVEFTNGDQPGVTLKRAPLKAVAVQELTKGPIELTTPIAHHGLLVISRFR
jgi:hypothetical protein